jgi:hypothetical protein
VWIDLHGRADCFPTLQASRTGKNGSSSGYGPKMFPKWFVTIARPSPYTKGGQRGGCIVHWNLPRGGHFTSRRAKLVKRFYAGIVARGAKVVRVEGPTTW